MVRHHKKYYLGSPHGALDKANQRAHASAVASRLRINDKRRVKIAAPTSGHTKTLVAESTKGTIFPNRRARVQEGDNVLKPGTYSTKIGGDVLKGDFKGWKIYTLTLEERITCPRACLMWRGCYGNSMAKAVRHAHGPQLEIEINRQLDELCANHEGILVRLHVLGDFYNWKYLCFWADQIDKRSNLGAFGFTAHMEGTKVGDGVAKLRGVYPHHFAIRTSGRTGRWGAATVADDLRAPKIGDAIVCPEQLDALEYRPKGRHCGNCCLCWATDNPIIFREH